MADPNFVDKTIWTGDNLDILRGMNSETVDLIYLDPPFNSNKTYEAPVGSRAAGAAFKDAWTLSDLDVAWMGLIADEQPAIARLLDAARWTHGKGMQSYLTMMAVRLSEMRRVLKPTGSIYLHCDPTASHYLKMLLDAVYGGENFRNNIVWKRTTSHSDARRYGSVHDDILFYTKDSGHVWNRTYQKYDDDYVERYYRYEDDDGRKFMSGDLSGAGEGPSRTFGDKGDIAPPSGRHWMYDQLGIDRLLNENRIFWTRNGVPRLKNYLDEAPGIALQDVWNDVTAVRSWHKERIGYPTQKPLALLERIVKASSKEGDMVLDPFAGCATACVAAEKLGRQWVGIDLSEKAVELVNVRLRDFMGGLFHDRLVTARTDIPRRTDIDAPKNYRQNKHVLFGRQEGRCNGCQMDFPFKVFEVDHVIPQSRGGTDHPDNLQLLCSHCNRLKGDRDQAYLMTRLNQGTAV